ncbi:MAG: DinB family protein [Acidobacteriota bacterium]
MNRQDIELLYQYDRWANELVFGCAAKLTEGQFTKDMQSSHHSVRDTLAHIVGAEWIWLKRWLGTSPKSLFDPAEFPDVASLTAKMKEVEQDQIEFIGKLTDEGLAEVIGYTNMKGEQWAYPLGHLMQHLVNHSSYHRGQVTTMLRQLGGEVASVDLLYFFDAKQ